jgi:hypothetical protein
MLCAVAVAAVVLVHKESSVNVPEEAPGGELNALEDKPLSHFDEMMLFQDYKHAQRNSKLVRHRKHRILHDLAEESDWDEEVIRLEKPPVPPKAKKQHTVAKPPQKTAAKASPANIVPEDPVLDDTLSPIHASLRTGHIEQYSEKGYDSNAVGAAVHQAKRALSEGHTESEAFKKAQTAATHVVVGDSAVSEESPAFSRTIRAAAYAAEMKALKSLESGATGDAAKQAAKDAARDMVSDERALAMAVPVPSTLSELLGNVDNLWNKMKSNLATLSNVIGHIPLKECEDARTAAVQAKLEMLGAVHAAGQHILKGHHHKQVMEAALLQVDQHEDHMRELLAQPTTELVQKQVKAINSKAAMGKQASALHHQHARKQAHLAEGFLALAKQHHEDATDAAKHCRAQAMVAKFAYAQKQLHKYDEDIKKAALERQNKKAEAARVAEMKREEVALAKTMQGRLQLSMAEAAKAAAMGSMKSFSGNAEILTDNSEAAVAKAQAAAVAACSSAMKVAAKNLAKDMAAVAVKHGQSTKAAMKQAILTVLQMGRPLEAGAVSDAVKEAATWETAHRHAAFRATHKGLMSSEGMMPTKPKVEPKPPAPKPPVKPVVVPKKEPVKPAVAPKKEPVKPAVAPKPPAVKPASKASPQVMPNVVKKAPKPPASKASPQVMPNVVKKVPHKTVGSPKPPPAVKQAVIKKAQKADASALKKQVKKQAADQVKKGIEEANKGIKEKEEKKVKDKQLEAKVDKVKADISAKREKENASKQEEKDKAAEGKVKAKIAKKTAKESATKSAKKAALQINVKKATDAAKVATATAKTATKQTAKAVKVEKQAKAQGTKPPVKPNAAKVVKAKVTAAANAPMQHTPKATAAKAAADKAAAGKAATAGKAVKAAAAKAAAAKAAAAKAAAAKAQKKLTAKVKAETAKKAKVEAKAANNVLVSASHAIQHASVTNSVQHATTAMSAAVTKATAEAAELARRAVAAQGGTMEQQLAAAAAAAAAASKQAAAHEASKLKQTIKVASKDAVVRAAKVQTAKSAKTLAHIDHRIAKLKEAQPSSVDLLQTSAHMSHMQRVFESSARNALRVASKKPGYTREKARRDLAAALQPVMVQEINRAASKAAATAGKAALESGSADLAAAQATIAAAAQKAARRAKAQVKQRAQQAIRSVLKAATANH